MIRVRDVLYAAAIGLVLVAGLGAWSMTKMERRIDEKQRGDAAFVEALRVAISREGDPSLVEEDYDRFKAKRELTFKGGDVLWQIPSTERSGTQIFVSCKMVLPPRAQDYAEIYWIRTVLYDKGWRYLKDHEVNFLLDGTPWPVRSRCDSDTGKNTLQEIVIVPLTIARLVELANAETVEMRVGEDEMLLSGQQRAGIVALLKRWALNAGYLKDPV